MTVDREEALLAAMKSNLLKHKDAVVIIGNDLVRDAHLFHATENNQKTYSRKQMIKDPENFWKFYLMNIAENEHNQTGNSNQKALLDLLSTDIIKTVIDMNYDGYIRDNISEDIEYIQLKGDRRELFCTKCGEKVSYTKDITGEKVLVHSDLTESSCAGKLQPTVPFYGSKISVQLWNQIVNSIFDTTDPENPRLKTHALILIGIDLTEDILSELVESYQAARGKKNLEHLLIAVTYHSPQTLQLLNAEFGTSDEIDKSLQRLKEFLKE